MYVYYLGWGFKCFFFSNFGYYRRSLNCSTLDIQGINNVKMVGYPRDYKSKISFKIFNILSISGKCSEIIPIQGILTISIYPSFQWQSFDFWAPNHLSPKDDALWLSISSHTFIQTPFSFQFRSFKIVYRRYAGLYFCFCVDVTDNNLMYLEAIHNFVEVCPLYFFYWFPLYFSNVSENGFLTFLANIGDPTRHPSVILLYPLDLF